MPPCSRCASLPGPIPEVGMLYIAPPLAHTLGSLRDLLRRLDIPHSEPAPNLLAIPLEPGRLRRFAEGLGGVLSQAELRDARSLVIEPGAALTLADLAAMQPLSTLLARVQGDWFSGVLRDERLISHFQPIVPTTDPGEVFAFECLVRGIEADGSLIPPGRLYQAAREADLLFPLDRAARISAIRNASAQGLDDRETLLFINFNPTSIYDPKYCLRSTIAAVAETRFRPERIVFEVVESDQIEDESNLVRICEYYREAGFRVALDDLGSGYGSLNLLGALKPDFVKLDMQLIRGVDRDPYRAGIVRKLLEMAGELGIASVAEGIETEAEWAWVREHGADFAQGYLFARPGSPPPLPRRIGQGRDLLTTAAG